MPSLPKRLQSSGINEPIVPRRRLSASGRKDLLTPPPAGGEKIRDHFLPPYGRHGREAECWIEFCDCAHVELPEMRRLILEWMDLHLTA